MSAIPVKRRPLRRLILMVQVTLQQAYYLLFGSGQEPVKENGMHAARTTLVTAAPASYPSDDSSRTISG